MRTINSFLSADHRHCDEIIALIEDAASKKMWEPALKHFNQFNHEITTHLAREEKILFPAFEETTGMTGGPTMVMRMEHDQMREILEELPDAINSKNMDRVLGLTETLMILIQQHNTKEEQMLYNMCDMHLGDQIESLIKSMEELKI